MNEKSQPTQAPGLIRRGDEREGYADVLTPGNAPLKRLHFGRLRMDARKGDLTGSTRDREVLLHILIGQCSIKAKGAWGERTLVDLGERPDVFSGLSTSVVLGPETEYCITPLSRTLDIAVAGLPVAHSRIASPAVIRPQDVRVHQIGEAHFQRSVREVLGAEGPPTELRAGETINPVGLWSSWPHHDFDADPGLAPEFEEVFLYFTKPKAGWGIQKRSGLFCTLEPVEDFLEVRNGDSAVLPLGDHPIVAGVESQVMYAWFYISPIPKVYARWAEDIGGYA